MSEVPLFHDIESVGEMADGVADNLLIEGDALHALAALTASASLRLVYSPSTSGSMARRSFPQSRTDRWIATWDGLFGTTRLRTG